MASNESASDSSVGAVGAGSEQAVAPALVRASAVNRVQNIDMAFTAESCHR